MSTFLSRLALSWTLGVACLGLTAAADDEPKPAKPTKVEEPKRVAWGNFVEAGKVAGEVEKVGKDGFTLLVTTVVPPTGRVGMGRKVKTESIEMTYHDNGLVRWVKAPPKLDEKGKRLAYTDKEMRELKLPPGSPGYAAEREALAPGMIVEVTYLQPKDLKPGVAVTSDYRVKYVMIVAGEPAKKDEKKDEKKK